jgi:alpha-1,3-glucan synthase
MYGDVASQADAFVTPSDRLDKSSSGLNRTLSLGVRTGPGHRTRVVGQAPVVEVDEEETVAGEEYEISRERAEQIMIDEERGRALRNLSDSSYPDGLRTGPREPEQSFDGDTRGRSRGRSLSPAAGALNIRYSDDRARSSSPAAGDSLLRLRSGPRERPLLRNRPRSSVLDLNDIKGGKTDFKLQKVDPTFNDTTGEYFNAFEAMLQSMNGKNSEKELCIEEYLVESEKAWFKKFREAKLGKHGAAHASTPDLSGASPNPSIYSGHRHSGAYDQSLFEEDPHHLSDDDAGFDGNSVMDEFLLGKDYQRPSLLKRVLQWRIGDWPIYSLLLALGQIMAANSFQITLLTGSQGSTPEKLYIVGGIYIVTSCLWWLMYRSFRSLYVLSVPFIIYGLAFFLIGFAPFLGPGAGRDWMRNVATGLYTMASASGSIYFALNFGDEGKSSSSPLTIVMH